MNDQSMLLEEVCLTKMKCSEQDHETNELIGYCLENNCKASSRFVCIDCIFSVHIKHQMMKLKELQEKINEKMITSNLKSKTTNFIGKLEETDNKISSEIEILRTNVLEIINNKKNVFLMELNDKIINSYKELSANFNLDLFKVKDIKDLSFGEYSSFINFINYNFINKDNNSNNYSDKRDLINELTTIDNNISSIMNDINKDICSYIVGKLSLNVNFFLPSYIAFEWSDKVYTTYSFYYTLSNNNMTALKSSNSGTITIIRNKEKLKPGNNYYVEYSVDCKKGGDYELGVGSDAVGSACWLRTPGAYGLSNSGFYENGKITKKDYKIEDGDIIGFQINLKEICKKRGICLKNGKNIHEFDIEIDDVYFLAAIRTVGNSVTVKECKILF